MIRRAFLFALVLVALVAAPAIAQYDGTDADVTVTEDELIVSAEGFEPNATVNYEVDYEPFGDENAIGIVGGYEGEIAFASSVAFAIVETGSTTADAEGNVTFAVANQGEGHYEIRMTDGVNTAVASVTVGSPGDGTADATAGAGDLPRTGSDSSIGMAQIGIVALAIGAVSVYAAKRRRAKAFT